MQVLITGLAQLCRPLVHWTETVMFILRHTCWVRGGQNPSQMVGFNGQSCSRHRLHFPGGCVVRVFSTTCLLHSCHGPPCCCYEENAARFASVRCFLKSQAFVPSFRMTFKILSYCRGQRPFLPSRQCFNLCQVIKELFFVGFAKYWGLPNISSYKPGSSPTFVFLFRVFTLSFVSY